MRIANSRRGFGIFLLAAAMALAAGAEAAAQSGLPSLARLGFKDPQTKGIFSCEGTNLAGGAARVDTAALPAIVYVFSPIQASARANIAALERVRAAYDGRVAVAAATKAAAPTTTAALEGLEFGFPVLASARGNFDGGLVQAFIIVAPGGKPLGLRAGALDWSSAAARTLLEELVAAYPGPAAKAAAPAPKPAVPAAPAAPPAAPAAPPPAPAAPPAAPPASAVSANAYLSEAEAGVVAELALARSNPKAYAGFLREYRSFISGNVYRRPGEIGVMLEEGVKAVDEAIAFLEKQKPIDALAASRGLSRAAADHARDQGPRGATGHDGSDGSDPFDRMERYGSWERTAGENIAYGRDDARGIVIQLIVDDGVRSRGHRGNIFNPDFKVVGVAVGPHRVYGYVCVQDFAGGFEER